MGKANCALSNGSWVSSFPGPREGSKEFAVESHGNCVDVPFRLFVEGARTPSDVPCDAQASATRSPPGFRP
jgi:hypothetical protein